MSINLVENGFGNLDLNPFKIFSRREICTVLRSLEEHKQQVRVLMQESGEATVTCVLAVDEETDCAIIDIASDPALNERLLASTNISFETVLDRIRIVFFATEIEACIYDDLPALRIPIPASVIRLQRREFYRVPTPVAAPIHCTIQVNAAQGQQNISLPLQNVSGGGIAIIDEKRLLDNSIGKVYADCQIFLPGSTVIITTLQIRNSYEVKLDNGRVLRRIGCLFVGLPKPMLAVVQRYITKLEREQNAKTTGIR